MELTVVIPAFNEEQVIASTLREILDYLSKKFSSYEVIVVDDGSTDETAARVPRHPNVRVIRYAPNRGKGYAVKRGVMESRGALILFMDADNSTHIRELDHFMSEIEQSDIVIGSRALPSSRVIVRQSRLKRSLGRLGNSIIRAILELPLRDTQCGFKLFHARAKELFEKQRIDRFGFDFEILFLAHKKGYRIFESPVVWVNNFDTKVTTFSYLATNVELIKVRLWYLLGKY